MAENIKALQEEIKNYKDGSPDFVEVEEKFAQATADFEAFRKVAQREFLRKEADIYKQVYLEVNDTVSQYAKAYKYTLVMRFNREGIQDAANPKEIIQGMNRQVLFHREKDDITTPILDYLNQKYGGSKGRAGGGAKRTARQPGGGRGRQN
jgi:outer membrane protein